MPQCFPLLFSYPFLSSIRWLLTIKKSILLFRDSLIELFSLKNNALFKKAEIPLDETAGSVDLVLGSFRMIKEEDLKEQYYDITRTLTIYCLIYMCVCILYDSLIICLFITIFVLF